VAALIPFWPNMSLQSVNRASNGPNQFAIAAERFAAVATARAVAAAIRFFHFTPHWVDVRMSSSRQLYSNVQAMSLESRHGELPRLDGKPPRFPGVQCRNCTGLAEMPVGYHRDVAAASPRGSRDRPVLWASGVPWKSASQDFSAWVARRWLEIVLKA